MGFRSQQILSSPRKKGSSKMRAPRLLGKGLLLLGVLAAGTPGWGSDTALRSRMNGVPSGTQTVNLSSTTPQIIHLSASLPLISNNLIITGGTGKNITTINGNNTYRGFFVGGLAMPPLHASFSNLTLQNTTATGGEGGNAQMGGGGGMGAGAGLFISNGNSATLNNVSFSGNTAQGGGGGSYSGGNGTGGGGGSGFIGGGGCGGGGGGGGGSSGGFGGGGGGGSGIFGGSSFFGGGGGSGDGGGGNGAFGGGGGGSSSGGGSGGFGGGDGSSTSYAGGGGAGLGGSIFVCAGGNLTIAGLGFIQNGNAGGGNAGDGNAGDGQGYGKGIFLQGRGSSPLTFSPGGESFDVYDDIADEAGNGGDSDNNWALLLNGPGSLSLIHANNTYQGGTKVQGGGNLTGGVPTGTALTITDTGSSFTDSTIGGTTTLGAVTIKDEGTYTAQQSAIFSSLNGSDGTGTLDMSLGNFSLTVGGAGNFSGIFLSSNSLTLTLTSGAQFTLAAGSTFSGWSADISGTNTTLTSTNDLSLSNLSGTGSGTLDMGANALTVNGGSFSGKFISSGSLTLTSGSGANFTLETGGSNFNGSADIESGTTLTSNVDLLSLSSLNCTGGTLAMNGKSLTASVGAFSGTFTSSGQLTLGGTYSFTLAANSIFTGSATLASGTTLTSNVSLLSLSSLNGTGGTLVIGNYALSIAGGSFSGTISGGLTGSLTATTGPLDLTGASLSYGGGTTVSGNGNLIASLPSNTALTVTGSGSSFKDASSSGTTILSTVTLNDGTYTARRNAIFSSLNGSGGTLAMGAKTLTVGGGSFTGVFTSSSSLALTSGARIELALGSSSTGWSASIENSSTLRSNVSLTLSSLRNTGGGSPTATLNMLGNALTVNGGAGTFTGIFKNASALTLANTFPFTLAPGSFFVGPATITIGANATLVTISTPLAPSSLSGSGSLTMGANALSIGGGTFTGKITSTGSLAVTGSSASITPASGSTMDTVAVSNGTLSLTEITIANRLKGTAASVTGGTLFMDNSAAAGPVDLSSGTGTFSCGVGGVTIDLSAGGYPSTTGLTLSSGATQKTAIGTSPISSPISIQGGSADLGGATLDVTSTQTIRSLKDKEFPILTATGGITGNYGRTTSTSNIPYSLFNPDGNTIILVVGSLQPLNAAFPTNTTGNGVAMANYLDSLYNPSLSSSAAGDLEDIIDILDIMLLYGDLTGTQNALLQIQPSQVSATGAASFNNATAFLNTTSSQMQTWLTSGMTPIPSTAVSGFTSGLSTLDPGRMKAFSKLVTKSLTDSQGILALANTSLSTPKRKGIVPMMGFTNSPEQLNRHVEAGRIQVGKANVWVQPYGQLTSQTGDNNGNPSVKTQTGGLVLGADYEVTPNTLVGVLGGTSTTPFTWGSNRGNGNMNSGFGGLYGAWKEGDGFYVEAQTIFGGNAFRTNRNINFSTINRTASENHSAFQFTGNLELGYALPVYDWFTCQPFILGDYMVMSESGYTENGADSLNMAVKPKTSQFFQGELGAMVYQTFMVGETLLRPTAELGWMVRTPIGNTAKVNGGLVNQPSTLVVTGVNKTYNQIAPGVGLIAQFADGFYASGNVYAECGGGLNIGEVLVRMGYEF